MKTLIKMFIITLLTINSTLSQDEVIIAQGTFSSLNIKRIPLDDFYETDKNFSNLKQFGKPLKVDTIQMTAEPKWIFYYSGFKLTYVQYFPTGPELLEIEVSNEDAQFNFGRHNLFNRDKQALRGNLKGLEFKSVSPKLTDHEKFGDKHRLLEYHYESNKLMKIVYKIDPNL